MKKLNYRKTFADLLDKLKKRHGKERALQMIVGGEFEVFGVLERQLLIQTGLKASDYLIDVGCGSGRLAIALSNYLKGKYLGIDVVRELVDSARDQVRRKDWQFEVAKGLSIPEKDQNADMVCFFSVFTHLLHEQTFSYLREAARVIKPSGKIVFSFLEFSVPSHWDVFECTLKELEHDTPLNVFLSRDAIQAWSSHLNLKIDSIQPGDLPYIQFDQPLKLESGQPIQSPAAFGQSVCVLSVLN